MLVFYHILTPTRGDVSLLEHDVLGEHQDWTLHRILKGGHDEIVRCISWDEQVRLSGRLPNIIPIAIFCRGGSSPPAERTGRSLCGRRGSTMETATWKWR